jgi:hypothetical protein
MEDYNLAMFTHAMDFLKELTSLKKLVLKRFFTSIISNFSIKYLATLGNLLSREFMKA